MPKKKQPTPLFPPRLRQGLKSLCKGLAGFLLALAGLLALVALISYNPADPSLNTASTGGEAILNTVGIAGAYLSDFLWQGFGITAFLIPIAAVLWGAWTVFKIRPDFIPLRIISLILVFLFLAAGMSGCEQWLLPTSYDRWGGAVGDFTFHHLLTALDALSFGASAALLHISVSLALVLIGLWILAFALGIKWLPFIKEVSSFILRLSFWAAHFAKLLWYRVKKLSAKGKEGEGASKDFSAPVLPKLQPLFSFKGKKKKSEDEDTSATAGATSSAAKSSAKTASATRTSNRRKSTFALPSLTILAEPKSAATKLSKTALLERAKRLESAFNEYGVEGEVVNILPGPVVTLYEFNPAFGVRSSRVISLADEITRSMCSPGKVRIALVPGRSVLGVELPNESRDTVYLRELLADEKFKNTEQVLCLALGKNIGGKPIYADLVKMPHLLVAGTTGSGKSVAINTMILSLLYRFNPDECKMIMVDPKMLELSVYNGIPHLLTPVVTEPKKAVVALKWAVKEMEDRYRAMSQMSVRNIAKYNEKLAELTASGKPLTRTVQTGFDENGLPIMQEQPMNLKPFPHLVVIVDEMADLMLVAGKDVEAAIQRLAQMARAAGIHLIMATQRPSVDVITGTIKANFPSRISFQVASKIDSRTILNEQGAETLLGRGDMLFMEAGGSPSRVHGPFVSDAEVEAVVSYLKTQGEPEYLDDVTAGDDEDASLGFGGSGDDEGGAGDSTYTEAVNIVKAERKVSISYLQRRLGIGYNKAANIVERMEKDGIVSEASSTGKREVLVS